MSGKIRNSKGGREVLKAVEPIIEAAGGRCWVELAPGHTGHHRLMIELNGQTRFTPLSGTPSTIGMAIKYKSADVRRIIRELSA